jgi:hypothetical protein
MTLALILSIWLSLSIPFGVLLGKYIRGNEGADDFGRQSPDGPGFVAPVDSLHSLGVTRD